MRDIANDGYAQAFERCAAIQNRARVEQSLRGMFMRPVAGVDDGSFHVALQEVGRPRGGVAHDNRVRAHGGEGIQSVDQGLAFGDAGGLGGDRYGVRAEALGGDFETGAGARGGFEEQVHHHASAQQIELAEALTWLGLKIARAIEDGLNLFPRQIVNAQQTSAHLLGFLHQ